MEEKTCTCIPRVSCNVKTCVHNENGCNCVAPTIDVNCSHAHEAGDTCCNTFQEK
ncbi:MAG: DUF1540 domain-containing protein [Clostridia bacterium]|nr:DUF1540 domain-containing protein [Clostridia bacterium]